MKSELQFLGAAETVTGSRFLLSAGRRRYLVDCGLFQGGRRLRDLNWEPFSAPPETLDAVLITHAHIDHVGWLPRLVRQGYRGPAYATHATAALMEILLPDAAYLQEQDAAFANKKGYSRHKPALPLYTAKDAERALESVRTVAFNQTLSIDGTDVTWRPAGHILGSAMLEVQLDGRRLVFSGDLGRYDNEIMKPPEQVGEADVLLVESTYGDRLHAEGSIDATLTQAVAHVIEREGVLLIPAFAVGRTQQVLYHLRRLQERGSIPDLPVFVDSPMAVDASEIYCRYGDDHNLDVNLVMDDEACPLRCRDTHFVREVEESKRLNRMRGPAIIISASGMCTGGRIKHHLKWRLPDPRNAVLFVGYQAQGTRGRQLADGSKQVRIHGQQLKVGASVFKVDALSAHADRSELLRWLEGFDPRPEQTFVIHGEPHASQDLAQSLQHRGWGNVQVPKLRASFELL